VEEEGVQEARGMALPAPTADRVTVVAGVKCSEATFTVMGWPGNHLEATTPGEEGVVAAGQEGERMRRASGRGTTRKGPKL